jgi:multidrug transporter EmrE-like cation transporter
MLNMMLRSAVRITSFSIRAALAGSASAGGDLGLIIAYAVLSGVGFFGLLYSTYTLIVDR